MFGKRKAGKPKSPLGIVLYEYDLIIKTELKDILESIRQGRNLNAARTGKAIDSIFSRLDLFTGNISKDDLKTDYRSDKARDLIIEMIKKIKEAFEKIRSEKFDLQSQSLSGIYSEFEAAFTIRESIRKKLKDIENDYA
ncbi:MAG: hypothetical protein ACYCXB_01350 [Candidatus Humimicrobiaceae bacterium]